MKNMIYLANPYSPHVRQWLEIYSSIAINSVNDLTIYHIIHGDSDMEDVTINFENYVSCCPIPSFLHWLPRIIQYVILGIYIKFRLGKNSIIHAHNGSGYGLSALISGKKYILTTYGSEIYRALTTKSKLYKKIISLILSKAKFVTSTSQQMTEAVMAINIKIRVQQFSLGVSENYYYDGNIRSEVRKSYGLSNDSVIFFSNRRLAPLYNIDVVISAFIMARKENIKITLIQVEGDSEKEYADKLLLEQEGIIFIKGFVNASKINSFLCASDFIISIPDSDQLSSSILEGIKCNSRPIVSKLIAYKELNDVAIYVDIDEDDLKMKILKLAEDKSFEELVDFERIKDRYSLQSAINHYINIIDEY
ncbi:MULTISPECIES: glycosyltransferase [Vibrio]|uniref:glycosyltransferase n=1 Tax=Vibrio TaxID=662 RepID=UPI0002F95990|nr:MULTISPECIES: glycosyltransferase [Vibrio]OCH48743.1 hypothetical protein A6E08_08825 [Vibrio lentus]